MSIVDGDGYQEYASSHEVHEPWDLEARSDIDPSAQSLNPEDAELAEKLRKRVDAMCGVTGATALRGNHEDSNF